MDNTRGYCRCCHSYETLRMLQSPELDAYNSICNYQNLGSGIVTCLHCQEFLKRINCFRIEYRTFDEVFPQDLSIKPCEVEVILTEPSDQVHIKTENIDIEIDKDEVDSDPKHSQQILETYQLFKCEICQFKSKNRDNIIAHRIIHSKTKLRVFVERCDGTVGKPYECNKRSFTDLNSHITYKDKDVTLFSGDDWNTYKLKAIRAKKPKKILQCSECSYTTTAIGNLKAHVARKHNDERPFPCSLCNYCGKTKGDLSGHMVTHTKDYDKLHKCSECSYATAYIGNLKSHTARHHSDEKPFSCIYCNYCGKTKSNLTCHMKSHMKDCDKPFKCSMCPYMTAHTGSLKCHIARIHSDEKPFSCIQCDYSAKTKRNLSMHMKSHMEDCDKSYGCSECSYRGATKKHLKEHAAKHMSMHEKPFSCDHCNYRCNRKRRLIAHMMRHVRSYERLGFQIG